ncbi:MAG: hypothetical protein QME40_07325 [bacterium]|nr:hypothetical protein [bacterium]
MIYWLYRLGIFLVNHLPYRIVRIISFVLGETAYLIFRNKRHVVRDNLSHVLAKDIDKAVKCAFRNYTQYFIDLFRLWKLPNEHVKDLVTTFKGWENLEKELRCGKGVIIFSAHLGNWDIGGAILGAILGTRYRINVVAERLHPLRLYNLFKEIRNRHGMRVIPLDKKREILSSLRRNEIVVILSDRDMDGHGIKIPFFGEKTLMPKGTVALAQKTGAKIIPGFSIMDSNGGYKIIVEPEIRLQKTEDRSRDIYVNTERIIKVLERYISSYPEQWLMFQPIWKKRVSKSRLTSFLYRCFGNMAHFGNRKEYQFIKSQIPNSFYNRNMIDLGCGDGVNTLRLRKIFKPISVIGYDINPRLVKRTRKRGILAYEKDLEGDDLPCGELGVLYGVLHHISRPDELLYRLRDNFCYLFIREKVSSTPFELGNPFKRHEFLEMINECLEDAHIVEYNGEKDHIIFVFFERERR